MHRRGVLGATRQAVKGQARPLPVAGSGQNRSEGEAISAGARLAYFKVR